MYEKMAQWIDSLSLDGIPEGVKGFCFNLYDGCDDCHWSMELIGADDFDRDDEDWACGEVTDFASRECLFRWEKPQKWDGALAEMTELLAQYLDHGKYADVLKSRDGVGVGFTDGDIEILWMK